MLKPSRLTLAHKALLLCALLLPLAAAPLFAASNSDDWNYKETHNDSREFAPGGFVHVRMTVGDLHVKHGDTDKIRLTYTIKTHSERALKHATVEFDVHGQDATITFHSPYSGNTNFDVELEVPASTNLDVHEKVGDLTVENIEGDKDLSLGVGDLHVAIPQAGYRLVNASTGIGDVDGNGYGESSGWLGKSLKYHGDGKYELRAHVGVGDIQIER